MQTFLPYADFSMSAKVLDRQRLGKQRVECLQLLKVLKQGEWTCMSCKMPVTHFNEHKTGYHCYYCEAPLKRTPWYNHPAAQMWKGYTGGLLLYLSEICREWTQRGYKDTCMEKARLFVDDQPIFLPDWIGDESFHKSHQSNLLRKNAEHYGQYFLGVPNDLPYVWPSKYE